MKKQQGFKNAPSVTMFAVGMKVWDDSLLLGTVTWVGSLGAYMQDPKNSRLTWQPTSKIPHLSLVLHPSCMWNGREYLRKKDPSFRVEILASPEFTEHNLVHYYGYSVGFNRWMSEDFLLKYKPASLAPKLPETKTKKSLVYLAGPYSCPDPALRKLRFDKITEKAAELMKKGEIVFSPISHSHPITQHGLGETWEAWEDFDRSIVSICNKMYVYKLPGWSFSEGVRAEMKLAEELNIPIEFLDYKG